MHNSTGRLVMSLQMQSGRRSALRRLRMFKSVIVVLTCLHEKYLFLVRTSCDISDSVKLDAKLDRRQLSEWQVRQASDAVDLLYFEFSAGMDREWYASNVQVLEPRLTFKFVVSGVRACESPTRFCPARVSVEQPTRELWALASSDWDWWGAWSPAQPANCAADDVAESKVSMAKVRGLQFNWCGFWSSRLLEVSTLTISPSMLRICWPRHLLWPSVRTNRSPSYCSSSLLLPFTPGQGRCADCWYSRSYRNNRSWPPRHSARRNQFEPCFTAYRDSEPISEHNLWSTVGARETRSSGWLLM